MSDNGLIIVSNEEPEEETGYGDITPSDPLDEDTLRAEEEARIQRVSDNSGQQKLPHEAITGFVCVLTKDGQWVGHNSLKAAADVRFTRDVTLNDMIAGAQIVGIEALSKRNSVGTAQETLMAMQQQAMAAQQQMEQQRVMQTLQNPANHPQASPRRR